MTGGITWEQVITLLGLLGVIAGLWARLESKFAKQDAKIEGLEKELHTFKLEVAEGYAKNGFIRDVEKRLGERFDKIADELHGMRDDLQKAMVDMAAKSSSRRRT